ncbi:DHHC palmitoyltransferase-domain-containing protein [Polychytrium aggregatum]|uniref:DHHC palmitoyltransferase-domain-containing protein n=1 Tax=Polychytrium aggregatum TaxID=110093 RepID=UPI0022FEE2B0|nr:DHHC palmitoyltransferase-domain-containing protein [Polychytrium aggregatum]KAI9208649.1 DHHC palmitoyltransferase-domain-containing protein [Polychytrium aggregatum]
MSALGFLVTGLYLLSLVYLIALLLFGHTECFNNSVLGKFQRFWTLTVPPVLIRISKRIVGERIVEGYLKYYDALTNSRHPLVQIFYLLLVTVCAGVFFRDGYHRIPNQFLSPIHRITLPLALFFVYGSYYAICNSDPGTLTKRNIEQAKRMYDYDFVLFTPKECSTCQLDKPARSKHCPLCNKCVARMDHHCAWVNNCIGQANQNWFLLFLLATTLISLYGSYLSFQILRAEYVGKRLHQLYVVDRVTRQSRPLVWWEGCLYITRKDPAIGILFIFTLLAAVVVIGFMGYQLSLIFRGTTTNESFKWSDLDYAIRQREVTSIDRDVYEYNRRYDWRKRGQYFDEHGDLKLEVVGHLHPAETDPAPNTLRRRHTTGRQSPEQPDSAETLDPDNDSEDVSGTFGRGEMVEITKVSQFRNIYDRGPWQNLMEVLHPESL